MSGMRGPLSQPDSVRSNRRNKAEAKEAYEVEIVQPAPLPVVSKVPKPPAKMSERALELWDFYWNSVASGAWLPDHIFLVARYIDLMVERETHRAMLDEEGYLATGSRGQDTPHPVLARVSQIDTALLAIEDRLGLSPVARARLGLTVAQTGLTLSSIKAALNDAAAAASGDPRDD